MLNIYSVPLCPFPGAEDSLVLVNLRQKEFTLDVDWGNHSEGLWFILICVHFPGKLPLFWKL